MWFDWWTIETRVCDRNHWWMNKTLLRMVHLVHYGRPFNLKRSREARQNTKICCWCLWSGRKLKSFQMDWIKIHIFPLLTFRMSIMEGPLSKWTNVMKGWQYRWFVLDDNAGLLSYYTVCNFLLFVCIFLTYFIRD